jgi:hypothetical protein
MSSGSPQAGTVWVDGAVKLVGSGASINSACEKLGKHVPLVGAGSLVVALQHNEVTIDWPSIQSN